MERGERENVCGFDSIVKLFGYYGNNKYKTIQIHSIIIIEYKISLEDFRFYFKC